MRPANPLETALSIWNCRKPVIAAVQGYALGQGAELAAICDLSIAFDDARFGEVQIHMGGGIPIFSAPSVMGIKQVKEYLLTGDQYSAQRALEIGMVNKVVPRDRLMAETMFIARQMASYRPAGVQKNEEADQRRLPAGRLHRLPQGRLDGRRGVTAGPGFMIVARKGPDPGRNWP